MRHGGHVMGVAARAVFLLCLLVLTSAAGPLGTSPSGARGGGPRIAEPQGRFDVTYVGPVEPISKVTLAGMHVNQGQADLVVRGLGFTSEGKVRYFLQNVGGVATSGPFVVDVYYNGQRRDTVKHDGLPPLSQQRVESSLANPGGCAQAQLQATADSQHAVPEASEANNSATITQIPPCPDLLVEIQREDVSVTSYRANVKVTNQGNRATGRHFMVFIGETAVPAGVIQAPPMDKRIENLEAGQSTSFLYGGSHLKTTTVGYRASVDRFNDVKESNENNNDTSKHLP